MVSEAPPVTPVVDTAVAVLAIWAELLHCSSSAANSYHILLFSITCMRKDVIIYSY